MKEQRSAQSPRRRQVSRASRKVLGVVAVVSKRRLAVFLCVIKAFLVSYLQRSKLSAQVIKPAKQARLVVATRISMHGRMSEYHETYLERQFSRAFVERDLFEHASQSHSNLVAYIIYRYLAEWPDFRMSACQPHLRSGDFLFLSPMYRMSFFVIISNLSILVFFPRIKHPKKLNASFLISHLLGQPCLLVRLKIILILEKDNHDSCYIPTPRPHNV